MASGSVPDLETQEATWASGQQLRLAGLPEFRWVLTAVN